MTKRIVGCYGSVRKDEKPYNGHLTRFSDSSVYDEVCILCGTTDGYGGKLDRSCPNKGEGREE